MVVVVYKAVVLLTFIQINKILLMLLKNICIIVSIFLSEALLSQTAFYNEGNVQLHTDAKIGFHTDVVNNGVLDNDIGFAGFYANSETRIISGSNKITFFDVEIDATNNLELKNSLGVRNNLDFIEGIVLTPRDDTSISLDFMNHNMYAGEDNLRHVDGYSSVNGSNEFIFPIGNDNRLRPMILPTQRTAATFLGAYFSEDPNTPTTFSQSFLTDQKQVVIENISQLEFWDLNGTNATSITLTWDAKSDIPSITDTIDRLKVVGWSISKNKWIDLGNTNVSGNLTTGKITSDTFIPNDFEIITIASGFDDKKIVDTNILFSPNGDNVNDSLIFENLEDFNNNHLEIFNRWGNIVYQTENYKNDWKGESTGRLTINVKDKVPAGTYFYILKHVINGTSKTQQGWIYVHL